MPREPLIPVEAGIQTCCSTRITSSASRTWIPAFAGMNGDEFG